MGAALKGCGIVSVLRFIRGLGRSGGLRKWVRGLVLNISRSQRK